MTTRHRRCGTAVVVSLVVVALSLAAASPAASGPRPPQGSSPPDEPAVLGFAAGGQGYLLDDGRFRPIAVPGATGTLPFGINDRGEIVGTYDDAEGRSHGFVWERGRHRTIDAPGATGSTPEGFSGTGAFGINDRGQIVGTYVGGDGHLRGYLWERGRFRPIDAPGATDTTGFDINDRGQITIQAGSAEDPFLNFLWEDGDFTPIRFPGAVATVVHKIDDRGRVVGVYGQGASDQFGFTLERGRYRSIEFPGATLTGVNASNTRGRIVGYIVTGDPSRPTVRGAILSRGRLTTFAAPGPPAGFAATTAYDINERDQIVGAKLPPLDGAADGSDDAAGIERVRRIELPYSAWEADVLPLNYTREVNGRG